MAREYREFEVTIPAGTAKAAPATTALTMPARIVRSIRVRVPSGPKGLMGFQLASSGVQIVPWNTGQWLVLDDELVELDLEGFMTSGAWQLIGYNTGTFAHTIYLVFALDLVQAGASAFVPGFIDSGAGPVPGGTLAPPPIEPPPVEPPPVEPPPVEPPPAGDGYALARANATAAVELALGAPVDVTPAPAPAPGTVEAAAYDAGKRAALDALAAI